MCHMQEANWFFKMPKTWCSYKDLHIHWQLDPLYMCVCVCVYSYCDEPWKCHLLLHMAVFLWCWQAERGYGIGVETAVFQNTAGAVSPFYFLSFLLHTSHFLGHYACCTHSYINKWTIKKKINYETRHSWRHWYFQQLEVEDLWDQNFYCIQTKRKMINKLERNKTYVSLFFQWEPFQ